MVYLSLFYLKMHMDGQQNSIFKVLNREDVLYPVLGNTLYVHLSISHSKIHSCCCMQFLLSCKRLQGNKTNRLPWGIAVNGKIIDVCCMSSFGL